MLRTITPSTITTSRDHVAYGIDAKPAGEEVIPAGTELRVVGSSVVVQSVVLVAEDRVVGILTDELVADVELARRLQARADAIVAELGADRDEALERARFEQAHNLLPR